MGCERIPRLGRGKAEIVENQQRAAVLSIIMPYWNRSELLSKTLKSYDRLYDMNMEVVIVDDGSSQPPDPPTTRFPVHIVTLPQKKEPKNPCVPINTGVKNASGSVIVITNPEVRHEMPVFPAMMQELLSRGPKGYVLASCWSPEQERWYCYPGHVSPGCDAIPKDSGLHFCAMMRREFFDEIGGFDEGYRDGAGYEDNDFIWTVHKNGGNIVVRSDLVVMHERTKTGWTGFGRNRQRFRKKWQGYL